MTMKLKKNTNEIAYWIANENALSTQLLYDIDQVIKSSLYFRSIDISTTSQNAKIRQDERG